MLQKQDQSIFTSLSHYILQKLIDDQNDDSSFKLFSFKDWSILIMYAIVIPETVLVLYFVYKLRQFRLILAVAIGPRLVQSLELHYEDTANAASSTQTADAAQISEFVSMIAELIPADVTLLAVDNNHCSHCNSLACQTLLYAPIVEATGLFMCSNWQRPELC
jgi:hypothetical protein